MKFGVLADIFKGAGAKILTEVEINRQRSNQHEFQGVGGFRAFLGAPAQKETFQSIFYWLEDDEDAEPPRLASFCTWSDVRRGKAGRSPEYHLYYAANSEPVVHRARAGDQVVIARKQDDTLLVLITPDGSTIGQQLLWLFGLDLLEGRSVAHRLDNNNAVELGFAARRVLADLGIEIEDSEPDAFDLLIDRFGRKFPGTISLSLFARETLKDVDPKLDPDGALVAWMEHEEALFRHLEREIVSDRLKAGFTEGDLADVEGFLNFSLSVQNRRKSRAGYAFGHHVEAILQAHAVSYAREATTEKRNAADFLFPGEGEYADHQYPSDQLAMLAVKTSCKDRWRQVLAEADRIRTKHLLTLEPSISKSQVSEMQKQELQLVVPTPLHTTYRDDQRGALLDVAGFLKVVREFQGRQKLLI
ncbi:type II restriction endonuclease [Ruegeria arenilitoris]|uniref:type II restriction endonuclease n=1 Tax=Ruegeria arenilitoris TaxID=1173585 RepID=UPI00147FDAFC